MLSRSFSKPDYYQKNKLIIKSLLDCEKRFDNELLEELEIFKEQKLASNN